MSDTRDNQQDEPPRGQSRQELVAYVAGELKKRKRNFIAALPAHIPSERFIRNIVTAININPDLLRCDERSFWNACYKAASDGLQPDGREGALVPFDGEVSWIPMVQGIRKKARNSGEIAVWDVVVVHAKDAFDYQLGDKPFITHKPYRPKTLVRGEDESDEAFAARQKENRNPGPMTDVYSVCTLKSGYITRDVMSRAQVEYVRDTWSKKSRKTGKFSPMWEKSFDEAAAKTVAKHHAKVIPMSSDLDTLMRRDEALYDMEGRGDKALAAPKGKTLDERLDMLLDGIEPPRLGPEDNDKPDQDSESGSGSHSEAAATTQGSAPPTAVVADGDIRDAGVKSFSSDEPQSPSAAPPPVAQEAPPAAEDDKGPDWSRGEEKASGRPTSPQETPSQRKARIYRELEQRAGELIPQGSAALGRWLDNLDGDQMALINFKVSRQWQESAKEADKAKRQK